MDIVVIDIDKDFALSLSLSLSFCLFVSIFCCLPDGLVLFSCRF